MAKTPSKPAAVLKPNKQTAGAEKSRALENRLPVGRAVVRESALDVRRQPRLPFTPDVRRQPRLPEEAVLPRASGYGSVRSATGAGLGGAHARKFGGPAKRGRSPSPFERRRSRSRRRDYR